ncbi:unnamed protein product [Paramecium octaurelia]|uniref:Uncharacterized protein n=1 Tax=Paramecium octaurelia TaxID=43137 RepID=A0A8S1V4M0_PAROT|nr:unnamed protein product [Paramecium octaurelia]
MMGQFGLNIPYRTFGGQKWRYKIRNEEGQLVVEIS